MNYYTGLDVSLKTTFISIVDDKGQIVKESEVETSAESISSYLSSQSMSYGSIGIESGQLSISLCKGLKQKGLDVTCVDSRHMAAALSARINKNDKNDARGIAQMMRVGLYKEVEVKTDKACQLKVLLGGRNQLIGTRQQIKGSIRGLLKIWGIKIGTKSNQFIGEVKERINTLDTVSINTINELLKSLISIEASLSALDALMVKEGKKNKDVKLLMSVPGVGIITALTFKATLDNPTRFDKSDSVGAYMGLTPRQYASGEINRQGSISKMGPVMCRSMLYEAAFSLLVRCKKSSKLKTWGMKLLNKKGLKKAVVAVARKLAVIMHRMLVDKKEFSYN